MEGKGKPIPMEQEQQEQQPAGFPRAELRRVLVQTLARHAALLEQGKRMLTAIDLVYPAQEGKLRRQSTTLADGNWITGGRPLEDELEDLAMQIAQPGAARGAARQIEPGFVGLILTVHAAFRHGSAANLLSVRQNALVASLVMNDGTQLVATRSLDDNVTDFSDAEPYWEFDQLLQLLYTLDDITSHSQAELAGLDGLDGLDGSPAPRDRQQARAGRREGMATLVIVVTQVELPSWAEAVKVPGSEQAGEIPGTPSTFPSPD